MRDLLNTSQNSWYSSGMLLMSIGVVSKSLGSTVETNNLNTCTSAKWEACANAAVPIKDISVAEFRVPEAGVTSTVSLFRRTEQDAAQYPINQWIVAGEPAVSQDHQATDIQRSYVECSVLNFT